jgi:predicted phosphohydrolase
MKSKNHVTICWATDLHLNFKEGNRDFFDKVVYTEADAVFITGDVAEAKNVSEYLLEMDDKFDRPIYFVLGNHDYYGGSMETVRREMTNLTSTIDNLYWLPEAGVCGLTNDVAVVGVDGWYDGRYGKSDPPKIIMNDWKIIDELQGFKYDHGKLLDELRKIAKAEADLARVYLTEAAMEYSTVYFLTHVPPWVEAAWHIYHHSDECWSPWFTSKVLGDVLEEVAAEFPITNFEVLAGHTHSSGELLVSSNLRCRTGKAKYGAPDIADMICIKKR